MKKFWTLMLALSMLFSCSIGLAACGQTPKPDTDQSQIGGGTQPPDDKEQTKPSEQQPSEDKEQEELPARPGTDSDPTTPEDQRPLPPEEQELPKEDEKKPEEEEPVDPVDPDEGQREEPTLPAEPDEGQKDGQENEEREDGKHTHSFSGWVSDNKGSHSRTCSVCGEKQTEKCTIKKKTVAPTCIADGYTLNDCTKCNYSYQTNIVKSNGQHVWTYTFTDNGLNDSTHTRACSACGETESPEKCKFGGETLVPPTCTEDGYYNYTCSVCKNQIKTAATRLGRTAPKHKGHKLETVWTPDENAATHSKKCQNDGCDHRETQECTIKTTETPATCSKAGSKTSACNICSRNTTEQIAKLPHTFGEWTQEAKIEKHRHSCTVCGQVEMKPCTFGEAVVKDATCTTSGRTTKTCTDCGRTVTETTPAIGHKFEGAYKGGVNGHTAHCSNCNQDITQAHTYKDTNFCTVCRYDGLSYVYTGGVYVNRRSSGSNADNSINKNAKTIYIAECPYENSPTLKTNGIGERAFAGNTNLRDIYIPQCLFTIDASAFEGCRDLVIHYGGSEEEWNEYFEAAPDKNPVKDSTITLKPNDYHYPPAEEKAATVSMLPEAILPERRFYL